MEIRRFDPWLGIYGITMIGLLVLLPTGGQD